jgi:hypothetical protein
MSKNTTVELALERIKNAGRSSPIIIFKSNRKNRVDTYFASTVKSKEMLTTDKHNLIGIFDKYCDLAKVKEVLLAAIEE